MDFEEKTISRKQIFKGKIIELCIDQVRLPDGKTASRELVFHPGAVAIIPVTKDDKIVMVKQYRKPLEKILLEIPAGKIELTDQNKLEQTAKRELEEETGYQANQWKAITSMYVSPGFADEFVHIFYASELTKVLNPKSQDDDEFIELYELTLTEAKKAIKDGLIADAKTIFAVQYLEIELLKEKLKKMEKD